MSIDIGDLVDEVSRTLSDYVDGLADAITTASEEAAQACVAELKTISPKRGGKYGRSWTYKRGAKRGGIATFVVYNKKHYQLTHLLERGHALKNGGRVRALVHIEPARDHTEDLLEQKILEAIGSEIG